MIHHLVKKVNKKVRGNIYFMYFPEQARHRKKDVPYKKDSALYSRGGIEFIKGHMRFFSGGFRRKKPILNE